eukprot:g9096.t1
MRATVSKLRFDAFVPCIKHPPSLLTFPSSLRNETRDLRTSFSRSINISCFAAVSQEPSALSTEEDTDAVRVRFAPSPTGNLHVGGARTALFNWLYVKNKSGKMILRIEDTDKSRSTLESEEAVVRDLKWLGLDWDEGPGIGGEYGPYRQSERTQIYKEYVDKLVELNLAYPCFCTDEELKKMKAESEEKKLPPIYRGKWATASKEEVSEMMESGHPYCFRFRVPKNQLVRIRDYIRGDVTWNTDTLGDFIIMRSNGMPVYNFCVAIDDALMKITHVIRAEEHLANTLRQVLIYRALNFKEPFFGHVSLILAPDKSKLSKRHGATSVGEFREQGYLPSAMINYLSLLGWNDGTEQEIFTVDELQEKFSLDRITKSAAVFDKGKLSWMNGQHLRSLSLEEARTALCEIWTRDGVLSATSGPFIDAAVHLAQDSIELLNDATNRLKSLFVYPLSETLASEEAQSLLEDNMREVFEIILDDYQTGVLQKSIEEDSVGSLIKTVGKKLKRRGKRIFMPYRIAISGLMQGPEVSKILKFLYLENGEILDRSNFVPLSTRMEILQKWMDSTSQ